MVSARITAPGYAIASASSRLATPAPSTAGHPTARNKICNRLCTQMRADRRSSTFIGGFILSESIAEADIELVETAAGDVAQPLVVALDRDVVDGPELEAEGVELSIQGRI